MRIQRVIFVDEHDTCRAPMAAAQLRACPMKRPVEILSRGLVVLFPGPLNQKAQAVLIGNGLSVEKFSSTPFDLSELTEQTLVLTMDRRLREIQMGVWENVPFGNALADERALFETFTYLKHSEKCFS